jgi:hypothetical protein
VALVSATACGFVVANIYYYQPSRQEGHLTRSQSSTVVVITLIGPHVATGRDFQSPSLQFS